MKTKPFPKQWVLWLAWAFFVLGNIVGWFGSGTALHGYAIYGSGFIAGFFATVRGRRQRWGFLALLLNGVGLLLAVIFGGTFSVLKFVVELVGEVFSGAGLVP